MRSRSYFRNTIATLAALVVVFGCSTAAVKDTWKDPAHAGAFKQILVVGVSKSDSSRRVFEDGFSAALRASGTGASPSYAVLPETGQVSNERLDEAVKKAGADAVLVTRLLRVKKDVNVSPGYMAPGFYGRGYRGFYGGAYMAMPPDVNVYEIMTIELTLFNMKTDKPAWSGTSEVTEPGSVAKATEDLAKVMIAKMKADGVI
ncbi:hypothetical protein [Usitatibacter palustris]|uniref:DUF4136 domain-containing protein n=1 Tax=Usitatibacter palustris TaxID=2732487 RepID=A0A6M4H473_9PROT|nr:hypothetical protein [Usitatibacter palustris]QJR14316.1 hypothetical protein DSM104440_01112 [Usitatibacter palustris]